MPRQETHVAAPAGASPVQRRLGLALLVIAAAQLMLVLDSTIMNVALPGIQGALDLAPSDLNRVITAYALGFGGLLLVGGRAGDLFGRRRVFRPAAFAVLLPAQLVAGMGLGLAFVTITIVGVRGVAPNDSGIVSGLVNASMQIGGALGLAVLVAVASASTRSRLPGAALSDALTHGYVTGLLVGAGLYLAALVLATLTIKNNRSTLPT
jgi:MFS family permease